METKSRLLFVGDPIPICLQQVQYGRRPPSWKIEKMTIISAMDCPIGEKFGNMTHIHFLNLIAY